jgi:CRISPR/Cas system-associated exonuclease Cas4 (RecB family)
LRIAPSLDMTPSDLGVLSGCFRFFHWTRVLGVADPGRGAGGTSQMILGSIAHKFLEAAIRPSSDALKRAGIPDLDGVFASQDWRNLESENPERELPFLMSVQAEGKDCWIRGRMDAAVAGDMPRVVDYKYAGWHDSAESANDVQMTAYALALMKALGTDRAISELWYLKPPMKIVRREHDRTQAEEHLRALLSRYLNALETSEWPQAERAYCDRVGCGFRQRCWGNLSTAQKGT